MLSLLNRGIRGWCKDLLVRKVLRERVEGWEVEDRGLKPMLAELLLSQVGVWSALKPCL